MFVFDEDCTTEALVEVTASVFVVAASSAASPVMLWLA